MEASANGRAKTVWENLTNPPHRRRAEKKPLFKVNALNKKTYAISPQKTKLEGRFSGTRVHDDILPQAGQRLLESSGSHLNI
jgi:hypothetical protein